MYIQSKQFVNYEYTKKINMICLKQKNKHSLFSLKIKSPELEHEIVSTSNSFCFIRRKDNIFNKKVKNKKH